MGNSMYHEKFHSQGCHISIFLYNFDIQYLANWRLHVDTCVPTAGNGSFTHSNYICVRTIWVMNTYL